MCLRDRNIRSFHISYRFYKLYKYCYSSKSFMDKCTELKYCSIFDHFYKNCMAYMNIHYNMYLKDKYLTKAHICFEYLSKPIGVGIRKEYSDKQYHSNMYQLDIFYQLWYNSLHSIMFLVDKCLHNWHKRNYSNKSQTDNHYFDCKKSMSVHSKMYQHHKE